MQLNKKIFRKFIYLEPFVSIIKVRTLVESE